MMRGRFFDLLFFAQTDSSSAASLDEDAYRRAEELEQYRALQPGVIRVGAGGDTAKVGNLEPGEVFEVLEREEEGGSRVRMERGWVSLTAKSGRPLCVAEASIELLLESVPLLQHLDAEQRADLKAAIEVVEFAAGASGSTGSTRNGRDSNSKRLGVKAYGGEKVSAGSIIIIDELELDLSIYE